MSDEEPDIPLPVKDDSWYADTNVALDAMRGYLTTVGRGDDASILEQSQGVLSGLRDDVEDSQKEDSGEGHE